MTKKQSNPPPPEEVKRPDPASPPPRGTTRIGTPIPAPPPSTRVKSAQEQGLEFQTDFQRWIEDARLRLPVEIVRLYDTRSAGAFLPEQGGDFILVFKGKSFLIDTKASTVHDTLADCLKGMWSEGQAARMRLWNRAGGHSILLFRNKRNWVECWRAADLFEAFYTPRKKPSPGDTYFYAEETEFFKDPAVFLADLHDMI